MANTVVSQPRKWSIMDDKDMRSLNSKVDALLKLTQLSPTRVRDAIGKFVGVSGQSIKNYLLGRFIPLKHHQRKLVELLASKNLAKTLALGESKSRTKIKITKDNQHLLNLLKGGTTAAAKALGVSRGTVINYRIRAGCHSKKSCSINKWSFITYPKMIAVFDAIDALGLRSRGTTGHVIKSGYYFKRIMPKYAKCNMTLSVVYSYRNKRMVPSAAKQQVFALLHRAKENGKLKEVAAKMLAKANEKLEPTANIPAQKTIAAPTVAPAPEADKPQKLAKQEITVSINMLRKLLAKGPITAATLDALELVLITD